MEKIIYGTDYITIEDEKGEIVHWIDDEWQEDTYLIFSICHAVELAGKNKLRKFLAKR